MRALVAVGVVAVAGIVAVAALGSGEEPGPREPELPVAACPEPDPGVATSGDRKGNEVALTFDDGPSATTPKVLRALERRDAKATFFVLGREIPGREGILRRAAEAGHQIGNHSTTHSPLPDEADIAAATGLITAATNRLPCVFRPPQGRYDEALVDRVRALGMTTVTWDVDTGDWATQTPAMIRDRVLAAVEPGSIVLMHDGGGERAGTARSISAVVDELRDRDYELVTVSDLLRGE